jgi:outer membrane protein TolC
MRRRASFVGFTGGCLVLLVLLSAETVLAQGTREEGQGPAPPPAQSGSAARPTANPFMGSVPSGRSTPETLQLTLADALSRGLTQNLAAILGRQGVTAAGGARLAALSALLPTVTGRVSETREVVNLEAYGFPLPAGMNPIVGPFNVFDARLSVTQSIFDLSAIGAARAGAQAASAAEASYADVRDAVVVVCANLYLRAVIDHGVVDAVRAQLRTAEVLHTRAVDMKAAGVVPGIDVLRAEVQLQTQRQRMIVAENELAKQKLALARAIGLPLEQQFELADPAPYAALAEKPLGDLLAEAYDQRSDLKSATALLKAAEASRQATLGEALPSIRFNADYGDIGTNLSTSKATYSVGVQLRVPLFQGGRVRARLQQVDAGLAAERAKLQDLRGQIEYEVRTAYLDLAAADERVKVSRRGVELSEQQLTQAQDRFSAGVANNLEVVQAQEAVAGATDSYLSSLYAHNLAKLSLARALGVAEEAAGQYLGGLR